MRAIHKKVVRDLFGLRAQVFSTAMLIAVGVALLVSTWSAYRSLQSARDGYYRDYRFADLFAELKRAPREVTKSIGRIPGVEVVEPRIVIDGLIRDPGAPEAEPALGRFVSVPATGNSLLNAVHLRAGRLPRSGDEVEVVVHEGFARAHRLQPGWFLSVLIEGRQERLRIVGIGISPEYVIAVASAVPLPDDRHYGVLWVPLDAMERLAFMKDSFNQVSVRLTSSSRAEAVKESMDRILEQYGGRGAYGRDRQTSNVFISDEIRQQRTMAIVTPLVFLGIASFLIHIIISRFIDLQRAQIATLKAIGYSSRAVSMHYFALVLVMALLGAVPGIGIAQILGTLFSRSYESFFRFPRIDFSLSAPAVGIGLAAGITPALVGAWFSIRSAFRLSPAQAMRPPAPRIFRSGVVEGLALWRRVPVHRRIAWRNVLSRPLRLALILLGLSMATCVVVASRGWVDILDFLFDTQFQRIQREDMSVGLLRPVALGGLQEISQIPGVLAVEGYRIVPVRIRHRNHKRELSLTGWPENPTMRRRLDVHLSPIALPEQGILLSRFFREEWGLRPGESVELEVLEGDARTFHVPVAGFTDDLVGLSASMRIEELWRLMSESPDYNLVTLLVDPRRSSEVYVALKEMPLAVAVHLKSALYRGFEESMGGIMDVMSAVLMSFSLVIALGIIFNSVQSSFSERSWELASLRILGFTRGSVYWMLMSEIILQVLSSLLPGCLLGHAVMKGVMMAVQTEQFMFPLVILPSSYALGVLSVLTALAVSGLIVRRSMGRLSLTQALKARE
jgi:putative ABC transport system permease protein